ncbi:MAG: hypothetical protein V2I76_13250, partial [Roseobacter sp.]|nr:hypothetical protein [Roseobacter sp.]
MRTILHVGMSKAGSTALQDCLLGSREILLEHGVLYPKNADGVAFNNHRLLLQPLVPYDMLPISIRRNCTDPGDAARQYEGLIASIRQQIEETLPSCLILSGEHMFRKLPDAGRAKLQQELKRIGAGPVEVAIYVRRPSSRYLSGLQQSLKTGRGFVQPTLPNYHYQEAFVTYEEIFGREALHGKVFDRTTLAGGSIITDFVQTFLSVEGVKAADLVEQKTANASVSAASMQLLDRFRLEREAGTDHGFSVDDLRRALVRAERDVDLPPPRLRTEIAEEIDYSSTVPLWLR